MRTRVNTARPRSLAPELALAALLVASACGGGAEEPRGDGSAGGEHPAPVVPRDPLALVSADAAAVVVVDLRALRASPHAGAARRWVARSTCRTLDPEPPVFARTDRMVVAVYPAAEATAGAAPGGRSRWEGVLLAQGRYEPADAESAVGELDEAFGGVGDEIDGDKRGHFVVVTDGARMASVLSPRLLAVGDAAQVERMLARIEGAPTPGVREGTVFGALDVPSWLPDAAFAVVSAGSPARTPFRLNGVPRPVAQAFERYASGLGLALDDGATVRLLANVEDAAHAQALAGNVRDALGQADLVFRLAGLPAIGERMQDQTRGSLVRFELRLTDAEVARFVAMIDRMLEAMSPPNCDRGTPA